MGAGRLARAKVAAATAAGRARGSSAAVQLWNGLEKAVRLLGRPAFVAMLEPTDFGQIHDLTHRRGLDFSWVGGLFVQGEVGPRALVVGEVGTQDAAEMGLAKDDY